MERLIIKGMTAYAVIDDIQYEVVSINFDEGVVVVRADFSDDRDGSDLREEVFDIGKVDYVVMVEEV